MPHLLESIQLLTATFAGFWWYRSKLAGEPTLTLDTDWFYRRPARLVRRWFVDRLGQQFDLAEARVLNGCRWLASKSRNPELELGEWLGLSDRRAASPYDPDRARPKLEVAVDLILISVLLFSIAALWG